MREPVLISADPCWHAAGLQEYIELGFEELYLHQVGVNQREFIDAFGSAVLPKLQ
jgi:coenzyme F420-dependent glucose-6-phosphate dehydrogenase